MNWLRAAWIDYYRRLREYFLIEFGHCPDCPTHVPRKYRLVLLNDHRVHKMSCDYISRRRDRRRH